MNWFYATLLLMTPIISGELLVSRFKKAEFARKYVHIMAGICAALLPLLLNFNQIAIIALVFTPPMIFSKKKSLMKSMNGVKRKTYGEILFSVGVFFLALWFQKIELYLFGVLVMGLSDGFASVIGSVYGKSKFIIYKAQKSIEGSLVFFITTMVIGIVIINSFNLGISRTIPLIFVALLLTLEEATMPFGLDNLVLPVSAAILFSLFIK